MNIKFSTLAVTVMSLLAFVAVDAKANDKDISDQIGQAKKDIKIMSSILKTSLNEQLGRHSSRVEGSYLANQGLFFELSSSGHIAPRVFISRNGEHFSSDPSAPVPPPPPLPNAVSESDIEEGLELAQSITEAIVEMEYATEENEEFLTMSRHELHDIEREIHRATMIAEAVSGVTSKEQREAREKQRELRKKHHELARKAARVEREVRRVEREIRDAELASELGDDKSKAKLSSLETVMKDLSKKLKDINKDMVQYKVEVKKVSDKARKEAQDKQRELVKSYANVIADVTCNFAGGLRSLKDDEHVTYHVNGFANQYFVFKYKDIEKCSAGKMNAKQLLSKATIYTF